MNRRLHLGRWAPILAVTLVGFLLRFWRLGELPLIGDESYHWLWAQHPDWAYFDHPAGVALLVGLSTALGGESEIGIRLLNALLGVGCIVLTYLLGTQTHSRRAGLFAALAVATGAPFLLTSRFVYPDTLQLFLLLLNLLLFWQTVSSKGGIPTRDALPGSARERPALAGHPAVALAFGITLAMLFNTKYNAYFYAAALLVAVLVDHRHLFRDRWFWVGCTIAALGLVPVVAWNASHVWASLRWQIAHAGFSITGENSLLRSLSHAVLYISPPLVILALAGLHRPRLPEDRLLGLVAFFMLTPVALSSADSPRNLINGLLPLVLLAGSRWPHTLDTARQKWSAALLAIVMTVTALYGVGTVASLSGSAGWPRSSVVPIIHRDSIGWREMGRELRVYPEPVFALDYSIAAQIWYYTGQPAYTSWGQYRIWGIPPLRDATIVALDYLPEEFLTARLLEVYQNVSGPYVLRMDASQGAVNEKDEPRAVRIWQAEGLKIDQEHLLDRFDFLRLLEAAH